MEIIVRIAIVKYKESKICETSIEALEKLITDHFYELTPEMMENGQEFREIELYTFDVNEILSYNEHTIKKVFKEYLHPNKQYITK